MTRALAIAVGVFLLTTGFVLAGTQLSQGSQPRFDWPDEMSNAFFARQFAATGQLAVDDPDIARFARRLHPRSVNVIASALVPGGFLGLPLLYGTVAVALGFPLTVFLTPLLVAGAAVALYAGVSRYTNRRLALYAAILFLFHPAVWYFSAYAYLPNMPFVALTLIGLMLLVVIQSRRGLAADSVAVLAGLAIGAGLGIRLSEVVWVGPLTLLTLYQHRTLRRRLVFWLAGFVIALAPVLTLQTQVFGTVLGGYGRFNDAGVQLPSEAVGGALAWFLPFGFHPLSAAARLWDSFLGLFWWYTIPGVIGGVLALVAAYNEPSRVRRFFLRSVIVASIAVSGYLVLLYGSWRLADPVILAVNTVGRSYVRYWLPLTVCMALAAAVPLARAENFPELRVRIIGRALAAVMIIISFLTAFVLPNESLTAVAGRIASYGRMEQDAAALLPPDAIILTQRMDKVFFPEFRILALSGTLDQDAQALDLAARFAGQEHLYLADAWDAEAWARIQTAVASHRLELQDVGELDIGSGIHIFALLPL